MQFKRLGWHILGADQKELGTFAPAEDEHCSALRSVCCFTQVLCTGSSVIDIMYTTVSAKKTGKGDKIKSKTNK